MFKTLRDKKVGGLQGFLDFRQEANQKFWKSSRDQHVLDELAGCGVTRDMELGQCPADPDSYWRILNAYTAVSTHKVGGLNGAALSDAATAFTMNQARVDMPAIADQYEQRVG